MSHRIALAKLAALRSSVKLQPHQAEAVERARQVSGMVANWRTGGGKTPGSIAVAESRGGNVLVVVPAALRENFKGGVKQFTTADRHDKYTIISYEQFAKDPEGWVERTKPNTVIADEFHRLRNFGKTRQAFESVRDKIPFMLGNTASLINNRPEELVPLINLAAGKKIYDSQADFARRHLATQKVRAPGLRGWLTRARGEREVLKDPKGLRSNLGPYVHRYWGDKEFNKNFPSLKEERVHVELTSRQRKLQDAVLKANPDLAKKIKLNLPPSKRDLQNMNAFSVALRQIANNPGEFDLSIKDPIKESPKFQRMLSEQQARAKSDPNFRAVIYSNFLTSGVKPVVDEANKRGLPAQTFMGGLSDKQRAQIVQDFNAGRVKVLGVSPAGGEGLDLKGVKLIQLTEGHWNPEKSQQAIGRGVRFRSHAHLPEQERNVLVQRIIARHPRRFIHRLGVRPDTSIDEWIDERRMEKERLNQQFLNALDGKR